MRLNLDRTTTGAQFEAVVDGLAAYLESFVKARRGGRPGLDGPCLEDQVRAIRRELTRRYSAAPARFVDRETIRAEIRSAIEDDLLAWVKANYPRSSDQALRSRLGGRCKGDAPEIAIYSHLGWEALKRRFRRDPSRFGDEEAIRREVGSAIDEALFQVTTEKFARYLETRLARSLGNRAGQEGWSPIDLAQDCRLKLWDQFVGDPTWIGNIGRTCRQIRFAIHDVLSATKKRVECPKGRAHARTSNLDEPGEVIVALGVLGRPVEETSVTGRVRRRLAAEAVEAAVAGLSTRSAVAIRVRYLGEKQSLRSTAETLGYSGKTTFNLLRRALKRLGSLLAFHPDVSVRAEGEVRGRLA